MADLTASVAQALMRKIYIAEGQRGEWIGNWKITQDSPAYGCDDNPSYDWFANEYRNGHWTGKFLRAPEKKQLIATIDTRLTP